MTGPIWKTSTYPRLLPRSPQLTSYIFPHPSALMRRDLTLPKLGVLLGHLPRGRLEYAGVCFGHVCMQVVVPSQGLRGAHAFCGNARVWLRCMPLCTPGLLRRHALERGGRQQPPPCTRWTCVGPSPIRGAQGSPAKRCSSAVDDSSCDTCVCVGVPSSGCCQVVARSSCASGTERTICRTRWRPREFFGPRFSVVG